MTDEGYTRRSSYGPTSPAVGERGARTRQQIIDAGLACFIERGFHATSVEEIASRAQTSRATLYQYFESKDALFSELMYASGNTVIRITKQLGPLGPTAAGYRNLAHWVGEFVANYDRHAPVFIEWSNVLAPASPLRPDVSRFNKSFWKKIGKEIAAGGHPDAPQLSAIMVSALLTRFNYLRHVYRPGLTDEQSLASLTVALQLYLFPTTPTKVLARDPIGSPSDSPNDQPPPISGIGPLAKLPTRDSSAVADRFDGLNPQARATAARLLDAARRVFNDNGYAASNIDHVVAEAGLARGTFYRYFETTFDLLEPLAIDAAGTVRTLFQELPAAARRPALLREWLGRMLEQQRAYSGVMRAWSAAHPAEPGLLATTADVVGAISDAIVEIFGTARPYPLARRAAGMLLSGLVDHFPNESLGAHPRPTDTQIVAAQANFVERAILPPKRRR